MYLPDGGYVGGTYSRTRVQKDPANLAPSTFNYNSNRPNDVSPRLQPVTQNAGGTSPIPNQYVGASLCTFAYGGIAPDDGKTGNDKHPMLNLIKGPKPTVSYDESDNAIFKYDPTFASEANYGGTVGDGADYPDYTTVTPPSPSTKSPFVPSTANTRYGDAPILSTYNIWKLNNTDETKLTYQKNFGPKFPDGYQGPTIRQVINSDGSCALEVAAQNVEADIQRIFPISRDLMYEEGAKLYYPTTSGQTFSREIKARGGKNCGFQIHFKHASVAAMTNPKAGDSTGSIRIVWGNIGDYPKKGDYITNYQLTLVPGKAPELKFYHPGKGEWTSFPLNGPTFGSGSYSVYVHYAGPSLLIGFDTDMSQWNAFTPIDDRPSGDYARVYEHLIDETASIRMILTNITTAFRYGGIAFNNYNPEQRVPDSEGVIDPDSDYGFTKVQFSAPANKASTISQEAIQANLTRHRYLGKSLQDFEDDFESNASCYGDWRSAEPEMVYLQTSLTTTTLGVQVEGIVRCKTTIEGPHLLHIRNTDAGTATASQGQTVGESASGSFSSQSATPLSVDTPATAVRARVVEELPWGDISQWLTGWEVDYSLTGNNRTIMEGRANITLVNMALSDEGSQILDVLENNNLVVTLAAGYGDTPVYFQGIVESQKTVRDGDKMVTILTATDIATKCLSDIPFRSVLYFGGMRYGRILDYCLACSGFGDHYVRQTSSNGEQFTVFQNNMNFRLSNSPISESLANDVLNANFKKVILDVVRPTLELISSREALPVLFWDPQEQLVRINWRYEPDAQDSLTFLGAPTAENIAFYPNTDPDSLLTETDTVVLSGDEGEDTGEVEEPPVDPLAVHGVLQSKYTIFTNNNQLVAGITLYGQALDSRMIVEDRVFEDAFSEAALQRLKDSVGQGKGADAAQIGYVGYRKHIVDTTKTTTIPDKLALKRYVDDLERDFLRQTYQTIEFDCYVARPLNHQSTFVIQTFVGNAVPDVTDAYLYRQVSYSFDKASNTITAAVKGEKFPTMIRALDRGEAITSEDMI
jgi:hypothetical protein